MTASPDDWRVRLRPLLDDDEHAVRAAQIAMSGDDFEFALGLTPDDPWPGYLRQLADEHAGVSLRPDRVPATFLVADVAGEIVGRVSVRHRLSERLLARGGHIGYGVLPGFRRRGYGTEILQQGLIVARAIGVGRVLVTCDDDNAGSVTVIERCGGRLDEDRPTTAGRVVTRRYWID